MNIDIIEAKLEMIEEELEDSGKISFVTNYETAKEIALEYGCLDYEDYIGIDLQSDMDGYLVDIIEGELFVVEPILRKDKYFNIECEQLIIDGDIEKYLDKEFYEHLYVEDVIKVDIVDEEEDDLEEYCDNDCHEEVPEEINDLIEGVIDEINDGKCLKCALLELYGIAQRDGFNSLALGLSDMLLDIVEED